MIQMTVFDILLLLGGGILIGHVLTLLVIALGWFKRVSIYFYPSEDDERGHD